MDIGVKMIIGYFAAIFTVCMKVPQIYHTIKTKKTDDISLWFLWLTMISHITWFIYGILDNYNVPIIIPATFGIILTTILIILKYKYDTKNKEIITEVTL